MPIAAVVFDFKPMSAQEYFDRLAGLSDSEIVRTWLGNDHPDVQAVIDERIRRVLAMQGTLEPYRLAQADELIDRLDLDVIRRCLS